MKPNIQILQLHVENMLTTKQSKQIVKTHLLLTMSLTDTDTLQ